MRSSLSFWFGFLLVFCGLGIVGCEHERYSDGYSTTDTYSSGNNDYPRYVTVDVYAYTSWPIDVYIGDAPVGTMMPGEHRTFSKELYDGEMLRMKFEVHNPSGQRTVIYTSFDDDYSNYHVNVYNNFAERF